MGGGRGGRGGSCKRAREKDSVRASVPTVLERAICLFLFLFERETKESVKREETKKKIAKQTNWRVKIIFSLGVYTTGLPPSPQISFPFLGNHTCGCWTFLFVVIFCFCFLVQTRVLQDKNKT